MIRPITLAVTLSALAAHAGGPPPRNPLQPNYYVEANANAYAKANASNHTQVTQHVSSQGGTGGAVNIAKGALHAQGGAATAHGGDAHAYGGSGGAGGLGGAGGDGGNVGNISLIQQADQRRIPVNTAWAPNLTSSGEDTCLGSFSGGAQHSVFGFSLGTTTRDDNCVRLKRSKMLASLGEPEAAMAYWCGDDDMRAAMQRAGISCEGDYFARARRARLTAVVAVAEKTIAPALAPSPQPSPSVREREAVPCKVVAAKRAKRRVCK